MADEKGNDDKKESEGEIDGNFRQHSKQQCIAYLLSLNDPGKSFYSNNDLEAYNIDTLRLWATNAFKFLSTLKRQTLVAGEIA